jgi:hypothetical protein
VQQQAADYYASYMDEAGIEATGTAPLKPLLDRIAAIDSASSLSRALGEELRADVDALNATDFYTDRLFGLWVTADLNAPTASVPYLLQGGLDMPDREYYVDDSPRMADVRKEFIAHVSRTLGLAGVAKPGERRRGARARNAHGSRARHAGRVARGAESEQPVGARRVRREGAGPRLARVLCGRAARSGAHHHRLASRGHARAVGARAQPAAGFVEALAHVPRHRSQRRGAAEGVRGRALRLSLARC